MPNDGVRDATAYARFKTQSKRVGSQSIRRYDIVGCSPSRRVCWSFEERDERGRPKKPPLASPTFPGRQRPGLAGTRARREFRSCTTRRSAPTISSLRWRLMASPKRSTYSSLTHLLKGSLIGEPDRRSSTDFHSRTIAPLNPRSLHEARANVRESQVTTRPADARQPFPQC